MGQVRESTWKVSSSKMLIPVYCDYVYVCVCMWSHFRCVWLFCDLMDCNFPGSSIHRILQVRILEWIAMPFSKGSSWSRGVIMCESESEVAQSCLILCNPMDCRLPCPSVCGIFQARVLELVAISFSRGSSWPRDRTRVSCNCRQMLYRLSHPGKLIMCIYPKENIEELHQVTCSMI